MATPVADRSSNKNDLIVNAAETIGRSKDRASVFREIYRGKRQIKTVVELMRATGLLRTRVLDAGRTLDAHDIVAQTKVAKVTAYEKIDFYQRHRDRILRAAVNAKARNAIPTKRAPSKTSGFLRVSVDLRAPKKSVRAKRVTIDDIESFAAVRRIPQEQDYIDIRETKFKHGVAKILGERGTFNDWGGEQSDLISTRLVIKGTRHSAAFAFKGPGKSGILTPAKLGKNGDQIQRLARCPADVFLIQYWQQISDSVIEQLEKLMQLKSFIEARPIWYGVIDGQDSARLILAYPRKFDHKQKGN